MASIGAISSSLRHQCWNPRKANFFPSFEAEIELDRHVIRPYKMITGRLKLNTSTLIRFNGGLRIQLDANVKLRFQTKFDNRVTTNWAMESIFQTAPPADDGNYVLSPVRQQLLGDEDNMDQSCSMEPGSYVYPFELHMPGEPLPAPFKSQFGCLQFYIAAYMGSPYCYVQITETLVGFGGFNDLTQCPKASEPLTHSSFLHESVFSCKPLATFVLTSDRSGYHPGEEIPFTLTVENPKGREIQSAVVNLLRKAVYNAQGAIKTTSVVLDTFEADMDMCAGPDGLITDKSASNTDQELAFMGTVTLPKHCIPSYNEKQIYTNSYFLQYQVKVEGHPGMGKGEPEVIVGTTKPTAAMRANNLDNRRSSSICPTSHRDEPEPIGDRRPRSQSVCARSGSHHPVVLPSTNHASRPLSACKAASRTFSMMCLRDN